MLTANQYMSEDINADGKQQTVMVD